MLREKRMWHEARCSRIRRFDLKMHRVMVLVEANAERVCSSARLAHETLCGCYYTKGEQADNGLRTTADASDSLMIYGRQN